MEKEVRERQQRGARKGDHELDLHRCGASGREAEEGLLDCKEEKATKTPIDSKDGSR